MSNTPNQEFVTPIGRLVSGDPFEKQTKDQQGNQMTVKTGPNIGQPTQRYFVGLAFAKGDIGFNELYAKMDACARAGFPALFTGPPGQDGRPTCIRQDFAFKVTDGDGRDQEGKLNSEKPGYAGHWVVRFTSSFQPKVFFEGRYSPQDEISEKNRAAVRRGYYGRVIGTMQANGNTQRPGLYLNLNTFILSGLGDEIKGGADIGAIMASVAPATNLPAGMTALPSSMPGNNMPAVLPGQTPQPMVMPGATPQPGATPGGPVAVQPHTAILAGPGGAVGGVAIPGALPSPAAPAGLPSPSLPMPSVPAAPVGPQPTAKMVATGHSLEQFLAGGWTQEKLMAEGYLA